MLKKYRVKTIRDINNPKNSTDIIDEQHVQTHYNDIINLNIFGKEALDYVTHF